MIQLIRIVNQQSGMSSYKATQTTARAEQLEFLIAFSIPANPYPDWHPLIAAPFCYKKSRRHESRFKPPMGENVFYGSHQEITALYECAYQIMKQRTHLSTKSADGNSRISFSVNASKYNHYDINSHPDMKAIMDRNHYSAAHRFVGANSTITYIEYPSCRDPDQRANVALRKIEHLEKKLLFEKCTNFYYDPDSQSLTWIDYPLTIDWKTVS